MTSRNRLIAVVAVLLLAVVAAGAYALVGTGKGKKTPTATAAKPTAPVSAPASGSWVPNNPKLADVCRTKLPSQARDTLGLIDKGGPYPYRSDGIVFENREGRLPKQRGGYYHEYTVVTPGSDDRGTRRVVTGTAGEEYWTGDHYASFQEIDSRC